MKNAEIATSLRGHVDERVISMLQYLNAEIKQTQKGLSELASMIDQMANTMNQLVGVAANMREAKKALDNRGVGGVNVGSEGIPDNDG